MNRSRWEECGPFENEQQQTLSKQERKLAQFSARGMRVGFGVTSLLLTRNKMFFCFVAELLAIKQFSAWSWLITD